MEEAQAAPLVRCCAACGARLCHWLTIRAQHQPWMRRRVPVQVRVACAASCCTAAAAAPRRIALKRCRSNSKEECPFAIRLKGGDVMVMAGANREWWLPLPPLQSMPAVVTAPAAPLPALAHRGGAGPSRACFHGVPLIVPVELDTELKAAAESAAAGDAPATGADDVWGAPLLDYLTTHRCTASGACCGVCVWQQGDTLVCCAG